MIRRCRIEEVTSKLGGALMHKSRMTIFSETMSYSYTTDEIDQFGYQRSNLSAAYNGLRLIVAMGMEANFRWRKQLRCTWSHWKSQLRLIINFGFDAFTSLLFPVVVGIVVYSFLKLPVTLEGIHSIAQGMIRKERN